MADETQWYSVPTVARMLGISERAIRGRIERGSLTAELTDGQWRIPISALPKNGGEGGMSGGTQRGRQHGMPDHIGGMGGISDGIDTTSLIDARQQAQADAVLQRVLAPFIEQLTVTNQELGQVRAERDAAITAQEHAERIADDLRAQLAAPPMLTVAPKKTDGSAVEPSRRRSWLHRLLHGDFDGSPARQSEMNPLRSE